jgi:anti-sigma B factor antagonist
LTEQITVDVTAVRGRVVVSVAGEIDIATAAVVRAAIDVMIQDGTRQIVVDLQGVRFMDSTGLNLLIFVARQVGPGSLGVVASHLPVRVCTTSGIDTVILLFDSLDAAVQHGTTAETEDLSRLPQRSHRAVRNCESPGERNVACIISM